MTSKLQDIRYVLALDSAMTGCSAAVYDVAADRMLTRVSDAPRGQAEFLVPLAKECVEEAEISFQDIDLISVTSGPGSFTGLRVALSAAKSFALALETPVVGVETCETVYASVSEEVNDCDVCIVLETKRADFYIQVFDRNGQPEIEAKAVSGGHILSMIEGRALVFVGDALARFEQQTGDEIKSRIDIIRPNPACIAKLGIQKFLESGEKDVEPLYLRDADVSQPKNKPRKLKK